MNTTGTSASRDARTHARKEQATANHDPKELGRRGEQAACAFLEQRGFEILERNWACPFGEVDIIARDEYGLHFVEVKTRRSARYGFPSEAVDARKRDRYERIAASYLERYEETDIYVCFDIIGIIVTGPDRAFLRMHPNAFCCG